MTLPTMFKRPSALIPLAMSALALAVVLFYVLIFGVARGTDEGAVAHMWQLLIAGQLPVVAFFAIKWLPRDSRSALSVLTLQVVALLAAISPVYFLNL